MGHFSTPVLSRTAPADLTVADCVEGRFGVCVWCAGRCGGRDLNLDRLARWSDRKLLDLAREGLFVCTKCDQPAVTVSVSSTEMADRVLFWRVGDDCGLA